MNNSKIILTICFTLLISVNAWACDLCAIYNSISNQRLETGKFRFSISEQYSDYSTIQNSGHKIENQQHQFLRSSITQLGAGYEISDNYGFEISFPLIQRSFRRIEDDETIESSVSGLGDSTLLFRYTPISYSNVRSNVILQLFGGLKLPTGDSERLREEANEDHEHSEHSSLDPRHADELDENAVHGHDLALGSGSWDFPLGASLFAEYKRFFVFTSLQYTIRNQGDFQYRFSNDLHWNLGPGAYVVIQPKYSISLKANLRGEYKGKDVLSGVKADDTALRSIYLGPEIVASYLDCLSADLAVDFPLDINNSQTQIVTNYRIRAGVTWKF